VARVRFGSNNNATDLGKYAEWCRAAEGFGFELLGFGDSQLLWIDPFVALAIAAQNTQQARIGTIVANPVTRHPSVMAAGMSGLQQLSSGRVVCGIGSGDSAVRSVGVRSSGMAGLEAYCRAVRGLCAGREVEYQGQSLQMQWSGGPVPVWLSAEGPRMLELAGRIADGVVIGTGLGEEVVRDSIARVRHGAETSGRDPASIEMWWLVKPWLSTTEAQGWNELRGLLALSANKQFRYTLEGKFVPENLREPIRRLQAEYSYTQHAKFAPTGHNASLVEKYGLTEFLGRRYTVCGPAARIVERLHQLSSWGASNFIMIQMAADQIGAMRELSRDVFPAFR
jgi:5,10-methylenetetrahydromethanopterin reductase